MSLAQKFMKPETAQKLSSAYDAAKQIMDTTQNPQEALQKAGVKREDIEKLRNMLNMPMAGWVIKSLGVNKDDLVSGLNRAESLFNAPQVNSLPEQAPSSELERLQANLARLG